MMKHTVSEHVRGNPVFEFNLRVFLTLYIYIYIYNNAVKLGNSLICSSQELFHFLALPTPKSILSN